MSIASDTTTGREFFCEEARFSFLFLVGPTVPACMG
jgi:hypothetical protein